MTTQTKPKVTYKTAVQNYDHTDLATHPAYARLRQALSDLANDADGRRLGQFLDEIRDMALTAPYGDMCDKCYEMRWPHAVEREGGWITGTYRCDCGSVWTCGYAINIVEL